MKQRIFGIIIVSIALVGTAALVSGQGNHDTGTKQIAQGGVVIDVRTTSEYSSGHARGAINIPVEEIEQGKRPIVSSKSIPLYVYCRSGNRSRQASDILKKDGYTQVTDIGAYANLSTFGLDTVQ